MYVILLIYQYLYISELQIFSTLSMHNIKITAASQPTHSKPSAIFKLLWRQPNLASQVMSRGLSGYSGRYNSYMLQFYIKFVVQQCIVCCDRRHLDKSTSDYIRNTGTRGGRIFVTLVTSTPQQMYAILLIYQYIHERLHSQYRYPWWTYFRVFGDFNAPTDYVILLIYQYLYISELQIFSRLSMHNIKITAAPQPTHSKPSAILSFSDWCLPCIAGDVTGPQWLKWQIQFICVSILH